MGVGDCEGKGDSLIPGSINWYVICVLNYAFQDNCEAWKVIVEVI